MCIIFPQKNKRNKHFIFTFINYFFNHFLQKDTFFIKNLLNVAALRVTVISVGTLRRINIESEIVRGHLSG